jgi:hypothetical protein
MEITVSNNRSTVLMLTARPDKNRMMYALPQGVNLSGALSQPFGSRDVSIFLLKSSCILDGLNETTGSAKCHPRWLCPQKPPIPPTPSTSYTLSFSGRYLLNVSCGFLRNPNNCLRKNIPGCCLQRPGCGYKSCPKTTGRD